MIFIFRQKGLYLLSALVVSSFISTGYANESAAVYAPAEEVVAEASPAHDVVNAPEAVPVEIPAMNTATISEPVPAEASMNAVAPPPQPAPVPARSPSPDVAPLQAPVLTDTSLADVQVQAPEAAPVRVREAPMPAPQALSKAAPPAVTFTPVAPAVPTAPVTKPSVMLAPANPVIPVTPYIPMAAPFDEEVTPQSIKAAGIAPAPAQLLESEEQKRSYASGVMLAHYVEEQIAQQKKLHITLNKNILLAGIADAFSHQEKMSDSEVKETITALDEQISVLTQLEQSKKRNEADAYIAAFASREGVKRTSKGLYYLVEKKGEGAALKNNNTVEINYTGRLIDGTVVDGPQIQNANEIFRVATMPPVLRDSVKLIRKGGQITVVVPPSILEKVQSDKTTSPLDAVVIYTISLIDVNKTR